MSCFAVVNKSTLTDPAVGGELTGQILGEICGVWDAYVREDVAAEYGGAWGVRMARPDGADVAAWEIPAFIVDATPDVPDAIAYHDDEDGRPVIYMARDTMTSLTSGDDSLSEAGAHEFAETIGDEGANQIAVRLDGSAEAKELSDRLQGTPYTKGGAAVANFLLRSAWVPGAPGPWDFGKALQDQYGMTPGGYVILYTVSEAPPTGLHAPKLRAFASGPGLDRLLVPTLPHEHAKLRRKRHPWSRTFRRGVRL